MGDFSTEQFILCLPLVKGDATLRILAQKSRLCGEVKLPGSKSHTIRAVAVASLAEGVSRIRAPLAALDTDAAVAAYSALGARIVASAPECWTIEGCAGKPRPPAEVIHTGNSGTTTTLALGSAALLRRGAAVLTGDAQVRRRPQGPLLAALNDLGAQAFSTPDNGCPPLVVRGTLRGGRTTIECRTSQYLSSLLLSAPLAGGDSVIDVPLLHEVPYVEMTLNWLQAQSIRCENQGMKHFVVPGGQRYRAFERTIPADWSAATFFLVAGAISEGSDVTLLNLDPGDVQGDKAVAEYLRAMGARIEVTEKGLRVRPPVSGALRGLELDLNATPDALPAMAVAACFAEGETRLVNVPQARIKETDRLAVMAGELGRLGSEVRELEDGLVVAGKPLGGGVVSGHGDHRVVMALAVAGLAERSGRGIEIEGAEAAAVTFPDFVALMQRLGAQLKTRED